ncbi:MAG: DUF1302 family protein [Gammaproteobacteria bacterium]|nr:DUF1302 family protein [Gammaproteobacteria bacterium]MBQ0838577.1 DUF1302 family protein [Gammaproteobacteria bacterium]
MKYSNFRSVNKDKKFSAIAKTTTAAALLLAATQAQAFRFEAGEWEGYFDTVFSASAAMRVEHQKNFGTADPTGNNNLFQDAGDVYASPVSLLTDFGMSKDGFGFLTRFSYTYDYTIMNKDCTNCERPNVWPYPAGGAGAPDGSVLHQGAPAPQTIDGIADDAQNLAGNKFTLYDAFVYGNWEVFGGHPLNVRVGKQVINWGESNIQGGGISQMQNPKDLSKATTPGTDVKETLMPQESVYFNFGFTDDISLEAYYTWNWRNSTFIGVGTYFSPFDFLGSGFNPDLFVRGIEKSGEDEPDGGQYGINMHFIIPSWNYADLGIYYVRSQAFSPYIGLNEDYVAHADPARPGSDTLAGYQWIYGEDQDTYAISLNGEAFWDGSFAMELNLKTDFYDTRECRNLFGISGVGVPDLGGLPVANIFGFPAQPVDDQGTIAACDVGNSDVYTFLGNYTRSVGTDILGADKISTIFDFSMVWIDGMSFGDPTDRVNETPTSPTGQSTTVEDRGRFDGVDALDRPLTDFSWGYTAVLALEYNDVFANVNVSPTLIFVHNVEGYTPFQAGAMVENQRTLIAKVGFSYLSSTTLDLQYVSWLGKAGTSDGRDNVSIVFKRSF